MTARGHVRRAMGQDLLLEKGKYNENKNAQNEDAFKHLLLNFIVEDTSDDALNERWIYLKVRT